MKRTFRKVTMVVLILFSANAVSGCAEVLYALAGVNLLVNGIGAVYHLKKEHDRKTEKDLNTKKSAPTAPPEEVAEEDFNSPPPVKEGK